MLKVEAAVAERPFSGKNHDRTFIDTENNIFGIFDGAGVDYASKLAFACLEEIVCRDREFDVVRAMDEIHKRILDKRRGIDFTTGVLAHIPPNSKRPSFNYASAGDSRIYRYEHRFRMLHCLTTDEGGRLPGYTNDATNFLGHPSHQLDQYGMVPIRRDTFFALLSDGVTDSEQRGHLSDFGISRILAKSPDPHKTAKLLVGKRARFDDESAIVIRARVLK